jgi:hypothetical protein
VTFCPRDRRGVITAPSPRPVRSAVGGPSDDGVGFDRERGCDTRRLWREPIMVNLKIARRDHDAIGESDPLALVLTEELVADSPIRCLVFAPCGIDLPGDFGG